MACITALLTWNYIQRPALRHKDVPAKLARSILGPRIAGMLRSGATV